MPKCNNTGAVIRHKDGPARWYGHPSYGLLWYVRNARCELDGRRRTVYLDMNDSTGSTGWAVIRGKRVKGFIRAVGPDDTVYYGEDPVDALFTHYQLEEERCQKHKERPVYGDEECFWCNVTKTAYWELRKKRYK